MGNLFSLDLFLEVKTNGETSRDHCSPATETQIHQITSRKSELITANNSVAEICRFIEADSLAYLSLEGMQQACDGGEGNSYCVACYTGVYPTQWVDVDEILPAPQQPAYAE